ncbi:hypothetical protein [Sphingomonas sp. S2-65]|uniref:hypothetical protein n=1 Tax=Sphingomonas sp. S2-65 TaxID=2903960 RepID=UPI001F3FFD13|nr:hypothetical protein [Sphingomonas sp. S2-65]UYY58058.1 hypothetical protein LZ586_15540 [Sphingomonas sp. S2-65]
MTTPISDDGVAASHREALLDEALDETFPASDPISLSPPPSHYDVMAQGARLLDE